NRLAVASAARMGLATYCGLAMLCGAQSALREAQAEEWSQAVHERAQSCAGRWTRVRAWVAARCGRVVVGGGELNGSVVGLHMRRSGLLARWLVGLMASGAAFVPLDSSLSTSVVEYRLRDAK